MKFVKVEYEKREKEDFLAYCDRLQSPFTETAFFHTITASFLYLEKGLDLVFGTNFIQPLLEIASKF